MAEHYCSHPTCYESEETATMYAEPTDHNEEGFMATCGEHTDFSKDGIEVLKVTGAASAANAEILASLKR
jgi:hypothetical protein